MSKDEVTYERVLDAADPYCPKCGHNRDTSSVSSIDHGEGRKSCQMCGIGWREVAADGVMASVEGEPLETIEWWAQAVEERGYDGMVAQMLREYAALRRRTDGVKEVPDAER